MKRKLSKIENRPLKIRCLACDCTEECFQKAFPNSNLIFSSENSDERLSESEFCSCSSSCKSEMESEVNSETEPEAETETDSESFSLDESSFLIRESETSEDSELNEQEKKFLENKDFSL